MYGIDIIYIHTYIYIISNTIITNLIYVYCNYFLFPFLYSRTNSFNVVALRALSDRELWDIHNNYVNMWAD